MSHTPFHPLSLYWSGHKQKRERSPTRTERKVHHASCMYLEKKKEAVRPSSARYSPPHNLSSIALIGSSSRSLPRCAPPVCHRVRYALPANLVFSHLSFCRHHHPAPPTRTERRPARQGRPETRARGHRHPVAGAVGAWNGGAAPSRRGGDGVPRQRRDRQQQRSLREGLPQPTGVLADRRAQLRHEQVPALPRSARPDQSRRRRRRRRRGARRCRKRG